MFWRPAEELPAGVTVAIAQETPPAQSVVVWFKVKKPDLADLASFACDRSLMTAARLERLFCITGYTSHILCIISFAILAVLPLKIKCIN